jgi:hypothetical protein
LNGSSPFGSMKVPTMTGKCHGKGRGRRRPAGGRAATTLGQAVSNVKRFHAGNATLSRHECARIGAGLVLSRFGLEAGARKMLSSEAVTAPDLHRTIDAIYRIESGRPVGATSRKGLG